MQFRRALVCGVLVGSAALSGGCANWHYQATKLGTFQGRLLVEWIEPDEFIYRPDPDNPLIFKTADGLTIIPKAMMTDGGSIPRLFWALPGLSPWGFAPGYIVHDWLFEQKHCQYPGYESITFEDSARLLSEAIKTQMETGHAPRAPVVMYAIYEAVSSSIAREVWNHGKCQPLGRRPYALQPSAPKPKTLLEIDFGRESDQAR